ncbi:ATP-binding protein [Phaeovulum sp. W22_SRMD_FR3]|uniref:sensor histidine kinase n=1 Tax=Phaeovulum sp. W22_SRMD_FR3 TaxID=3240274 RepID=UPI003F94E050
MNSSFLPPPRRARDSQNDAATQAAIAGRPHTLDRELTAAVTDMMGELRQIEASALDDAARLHFERVRVAGEAATRLLQLEELSAGPQSDAPVLVLQTFLQDLELRWSGRADECNLSFHLWLAADVPARLRLNRLVIERMLSQVLTNAFQYTATGSVRLCTCISEDGLLEFRVTDTGPGFHEFALKRLFSGVAPTPAEMGQPGHGMGLYVAQCMLAQLGGRIAVTNLPEGGAEVRLLVPFAPEAPGSTLPNLRGMRVMLVDGLTPRQGDLRQMLERLNCHVILAHITRSVQAAGKDCDLVLIGVSGPDHLAGQELLRRLRQARDTGSSPALMALSGCLLRVFQDGLRAAGADQVLAWPSSDAELLAHAMVRAREKAGQIGPQGRAAPLPPQAPAGFDKLVEMTQPADRIDLLRNLLTDLTRIERSIGRFDAEEPDVSAVTIRVLIAIAETISAHALQRHAEAFNQACLLNDRIAMRRTHLPLMRQIDGLIRFTAREVARQAAPR